ncbi:heptahelical transmembrane protein 4-like [Silene latifolia]|uniref:heptahelical transmembrane protein 4-like n=1 Tax=Silene latifolia TaxID=37657 RepID=UPI003D781963
MGFKEQNGNAVVEEVPRSNFYNKGGKGKRLWKVVKSAKAKNENKKVERSSNCYNNNNGGKGKRLWNKVKYQLVEYHSVPGYLRDNEYIKGHYRADWPLKQAFFSIFTIHNETINVWTHLIGFFFFLSLTIYTANRIPVVVDSHCFQHLPDVFQGGDLHQLQTDLMTCLPTLPTISDLHKILSDCLPERFSTENHTDSCILRIISDDLANTIAPLARRPITRWPFFAFLGGAMFCLLASSTCHLLYCHSERLAYVMLRLDYAGIAALISTSFYPLVYYSFMCYPLFRNIYMGFITVLGLATVIGSLFPAFQKPEFRTLRAVLFSGMSMSGVLPILHKQILFWDQPEALHTTGYEVLMGVLYGLGALVYATRVPERWMPGKFDIAGHSHQLFHVLVVAGAYTHYRAGLVYLKWRDLEGC